ncbi:MAG: ABC transporter permease [Christensenellales bacterium]|jgi:NitT/TauT family transport system permease protein
MSVNLPVSGTGEAISAEYRAYLRQQARHRRNIQLWRWSILVCLILLWELATRVGWLDPFITSSPTRLSAALVRMAKSGDLAYHTGVTLYETLVGFVLGSVFGILIAIALWWFPTASKVMDPYLVVLNALPKVAMGPIIIVWMGAGMGSIIASALLISLVVTIMTVLGGFQEVSREKLMLLSTFGATRYQMLTKVVLPASLPTLCAAIKINVGMTFVGVIVGEFLVSSAGLGYLIVYGGQVFQLDLVMAATVILLLAAALMYAALAALEKRVIRSR